MKLRKFVLQERKTQKYVAVSGSESSYTYKLERAQLFDTFEQASADACSNEYPIRVEDLLS